MSVLQRLFQTPDLEDLFVQRNIEGLVKAMSYKRDWKVRKRAAEILGQIGDRSVLQPLSAALEDKRQDVSSAAARALEEIEARHKTIIDRPKVIAAYSIEDSDTSFVPYSGTGVCDVCNRAIGPNEAFIVPVDIFYGSKKYRDWLLDNPLAQPLIHIAGGVDIYLQKMRKMDSTPSSAVCSRCIHLFEGTKRDRMFQPKRTNDGSILGELIGQGYLDSKAASERLGYFDPNVAPFRLLPNGKLLLNQDEVIDSVVTRLRLSSANEIPTIFQRLIGNKSIFQFLLTTTVMPFCLLYSTNKLILLAEIAMEIQLNTLVNLLLNDPSFSGVNTIADFESKAALLLSERREEFDKKRQWAIDLEQTRNT